MSDIDRELKAQAKLRDSEHAARRKESARAFRIAKANMGPRPPWWRFLARRAWDRKRTLSLVDVRGMNHAGEIIHGLRKRVLAGERFPNGVVMSLNDFWALVLDRNAKVSITDAGVPFTDVTLDGKRLRLCTSAIVERSAIVESERVDAQ